MRGAIGRTSLGILVVALLAVAAPAQAATIVGQAPPEAPGAAGVCDGPTEFVQISSGYQLPTAGVITEWRTQGDPIDVGTTAALRVYNRSGVSDQFTPVLQAEPRVLAAGLNKFPVRLPVAAGGSLGIRTFGDLNVACAYGGFTAADQFFFRDDPTDTLGQPNQMFGPGDSIRADIAAVLEPDFDGDKFGDDTQDLCPTDAAKQGECVAPAITLDKTPKKKSKSDRARFEFTADDAGATFTCALDKKDPKPCTSPARVRNLKTRKHKFQIVAADSVGNVSEPTVFRWRVVD